MITALYASLLTLLIVWLSLNVIKSRRKNKVRYGDGDNKELIIARTAQSNTVQYIPLALLLLLMLELNHASIWLIHLLGITLLAGRIIYAHALLKRKHSGRVTGMKITIYVLMALAFLNIAYLPYDRLLNL